MNKIKKWLVNLYQFLNSERTSKYIVNIILCFIILFIFSIFSDQTIGDVISVFLGFLASNFVLGLFQVLFRTFEDKAKVSDDTTKLVKLYPNDKLEKEITLKGTSATFAYKMCYAHVNNKLKVYDDPDKEFVPDGFISDNYLTLFGAHRMSIKKNFDTVRLDDFKEENGQAKFYLSRSNYYYHLVTNRAIDYRIEDDLSLRSYYEYGPSIHALSQSNMSNHIGINALVYLNGNELLLPRRGGNSTISKNQITSSIAIMLMLPNDNRRIDSDYLFRQNILDALVNRTKMKPEWIREDEIDIKFLGFGQNPYEGGKPQFYYSVHLKNIGRDEYLKKLCMDKLVKNEKKDDDDSVDPDKYIYVVKTDELKFDKNQNLVITHYHGRLNKKERIKKDVVGYEKSFLANLWHDMGYPFDKNKELEPSV